MASRFSVARLCSREASPCAGGQRRHAQASQASALERTFASNASAPAESVVVADSSCSVMPAAKRAAPPSAAASGSSPSKRTCTFVIDSCRLPSTVSKYALKTPSSPVLASADAAAPLAAAASFSCVR